MLPLIRLACENIIFIFLNVSWYLDNSADSSSPLLPTAEQENWLLICLVVLSFRHLFGDCSARICQPVKSRQAILRLPRRDPHADAEARYPPAHRFQYDHRYLERNLWLHFWCAIFTTDDSKVWFKTWTKLCCPSPPEQSHHWTVTGITSNNNNC